MYCLFNFARFYPCSRLQYAKFWDSVSNISGSNQCCGSGFGSVCFWASWSGSGSISQRYGSGSGFGSFYHQAKIVRKTSIPTVLWILHDFLSLENDLNVPLKSKKEKKCHGSATLDPTEKKI
jgi:hypothetical protein